MYTYSQQQKINYNLTYIYIYNINEKEDKEFNARNNLIKEYVILWKLLNGIRCNTLQGIQRKVNEKSPKFALLYMLIIIEYKFRLFLSLTYEIRQIGNWLKEKATN